MATVVDLADSSHMQIPVELESSTDFANRVATLVARSDTRFYIDTSFLMWLTKIGRTSRGQLLEWLKAECNERVHVPVWSAHEYLRHHVAGTIVGELDQMTKELANIAGRTYANLRPFLDDPLGPGTSDAQTQQVTAREALNEIQRLAGVVKKWNEEHEVHAAEVIAFINAHVHDDTQVFEYMSEIESLSTGRFNGRLPPGFQDRQKKEKGGVNKGDARGRVGSNRWGDLVVWKEVLEHASKTSTKAVIILTNDRKNDWYFGGRTVEGVDDDLLRLKSNWKPVPSVHPMLILEARLTANVEDIVLLDAPYLGVLLRKLGGERVSAFVDVAIVPGPPTTSLETIRRKRLLEKHLKESDRRDLENAAAAGVRFLDSPQLARVPSAFVRALYESRETAQVDSPIAGFLHEVEATIGRAESVADLLTKERVEPLTNSLLTTLARELHDRGLAQTPGYNEALTDLVSALSELPELTAGSLYLGLIASMYLERLSNRARLPPQSPIASLLFDRQCTPYAAQPISALQKRFDFLERWPLYRPDADRPPVEARLQIVYYTEGESIVNSVCLAGEEVFTRAQRDLTLRLSTLFDNRLELLGKEVVESACDLFGVPFDQVSITDDFDRLFHVDATAGFKRLSSVYVDHEEEGSNDEI
jgi:hypothetical protein